MRGSSIMCWASAGAAVSAERIASAPKNLNVVICLLRVIDRIRGPSQSKTEVRGLAFPACRSRFGDQGAVSKQRRHLPDFDWPEKHRAVDEAQRKRSRLLAFQHGVLAKRVDADGDADIGVLPDGV